MADEKKKEGAEEEAPAKPKSKKKLIIIVVLLLLLGGGGAYFFLGGSAEEEQPAEDGDKPQVLKTIKLESLIVNLSEAKSFLKVSLLLEYNPDTLAKAFAHGEAGGEGHGGGGSGGGGAVAEGAFPPEIIEKEPMIRDSIIRVLSSKTAADVLTVSGKQSLKDELIEAINETIEAPEPIIINIYFIEFIIQ